jgi:hypothetical protein
MTQHLEIHDTGNQILRCPRQARRPMRRASLFFLLFPCACAARNFTNAGIGTGTAHLPRCAALVLKEQKIVRDALSQCGQSLAVATLRRPRVKKTMDKNFPRASRGIVIRSWSRTEKPAS